MRAVSDASPLIYLARLGLLEGLAAFYDVVSVPPEVHEEVVVQGKVRGKADALAVERAFETGPLERADAPAPREDLATGLGPGELEVIALAKAEEAEPLLDDKEAHTVARALGLRPRRTTSLLFQGVVDGLWSADRFERMLAQLSEEGYFITADVYRHLVEEARRLGPDR